MVSKLGYVHDEEDKAQHSDVVKCTRVEEGEGSLSEHEVSN